jgi:hypothetical protein
MGVAKSLGVIATGAAWKVGHPDWAGRALIDALGSADENARTIAGMLLTKGGKHALPLLRDAMKHEQNLPMVLAVAGSIGDASIAPDVRRFVDHRDPKVAAAARDALRALGAK